jgi:proline iminopeptidase
MPAIALVLLVSLVAWTAGGQDAASLQEAPSGPGHPPGRHVEVHGARLWVESEGDGAPLVLIAGGPGLAHDYFHPYLSALAGTRRLIYFDALGRGKSDPAASPGLYTFSRDVEDLEGLRKALGLPKVSLFGHSYGGLVAQAYAFKYPDRVDKVVLANSIFSAKMWQAGNDNANQEIRDKLPEVWSRLQSLRAQGLRSSSPAHQQAYRLPPGFYWHRRPDRPLPLNLLNPQVYYGIAGEDADFVIGGEIAGLDFAPRLKTLAAPLLVLAGRHDKIAPVSFALAIQKDAPRASVVVFEQSGHFLFVEENEKALDVLGKFLRAGAGEGRACSGRS